MRVAVIGAGYVGLTTGACLAELGHQVVCVDIDADRVAALERAEIPIYEPGLAELIGSQRLSRRLSFTLDTKAALADAEAVLLAVGTPSDACGGIDLSFVETAARQLARHLAPHAVLVLKSTVVSGTARRIAAIVAETRRRGDIAVASNPEFLREGSAISDFLKPDRIVIGADDRRSEMALKRLYAPLVERGIPLVVTTTIDAELIKYAANAFLALKIGFINDVADLCERLGGDVTAVAHGIGLDQRIGSSFVAPGPGFGGSCFPKDTRAFAETGRRAGAPQGLVETLITRNDARKSALAARIVDELGSGSRVAILGTAFKANTDDARDAAVLTIVPRLLEAGFEIHVHDPKPAAAKRLLSGVTWHDTAYDAVAEADGIVVLTEWSEYRALSPQRLATLMRGNTVIDYRNLLDGAALARQGLRYLSLGRPELPPMAEHKGRARALGAPIGLAASPA